MEIYFDLVELYIYIYIYIYRLMSFLCFFKINVTFKLLLDQNLIIVYIYKI
jgi:hypothetical protein